MIGLSVISKVFNHVRKPTRLLTLSLHEARRTGCDCGSSSLSHPFSPSPWPLPPLLFFANQDDFLVVSLFPSSESFRRSPLACCFEDVTLNGVGLCVPSPSTNHEGRVFSFVVCLSSVSSLLKPKSILMSFGTGVAVPFFRPLQASC